MKNLSFVLFALILWSILPGCLLNFAERRLTITIPKSYSGAVILVASNVTEDILQADSNGIGYITIKTFENTRKKPIVVEPDGTIIKDRLVGFNPASFWGTGTYSSLSTDGSKGKIIKYISFEVVPKGKEGQKQYYTTDIDAIIDTTKLLQ